jgi:type I restriction enzyme R subunit
VQIYEPKDDDPVEPPEVVDPATPPGLPGDGGNLVAGPDGTPCGNGQSPGPFDDPAAPPKKYVLGGLVTVHVARERVQYLNADGKLVTESLRDYTRINLAKRFDSLDAFLQTWNSAERKAALIDELERQGVFLDALADEVASTGMTDLDPFDLLLHVAYDQPPMTRRERARRVKQSNVFTAYGPMARKVIDALLDKYADEGIATIEGDSVFNVQPFTAIGRPGEIVKSFGGRPQYLQALRTLERELYAPAQP